MRQFLLAKSVSTNAATYSAVPVNALSVFYLDNGNPKVTADGNIKGKEAMIVLSRGVNDGGPVSIPVCTTRFSYVKGTYQAASKFKATFTVPTPTKPGDYSIIVVLKGTKFNERNKYTASVHVKNTTTTAAVLAKMLADNINAMSTSSGVTATLANSVITIDAVKTGVDYAILGADELFGTNGVVNAQGFPAYGDAEYIQNLASQAAAEAGFEYTYQDYVEYLYPDYPFDALKADKIADLGFTIFTLRFAEHRVIKTTDEAVNQIVQVAFPTGSTGIATFEAICKGLAGESTDAGD